MNLRKKSPLEVMYMLKWKEQKDKIAQILALWIVQASDWELVVPSYKCKIIKPTWEPYEKYFCFHYQVFWRELELSWNLDFAISETKRVLEWERSYLFANWTRVELL